MTAGLVAAGALLAGPVPLGPGGALAASPPHWGHYRWAGGSEQADIRAFWLFDRTGDARMHDVIPTVTEGGNAARDEHPELPYIAVYQDDANAGKCFVNRTPGYSVAMACTLAANIEDVKGLAARHVDDKGHLVGGAMAVAEGLGWEESFSVVCHTFGHVLGLGNSENGESCMSHNFEPGRLKWYTPGDAEWILSVFEHSETAPPTTTSTTVPDEPGDTTATVADQPAPPTTTTTSLLPDVTVPPVLPE